MNYIEKMLQDYCPNGVEWKELGDREVAKLSRGKVMSKQFIEENKGVFPVYSSQTANSGEIGKISTFDFDGEYITWTTDGANAGTVFYRQGKFSITNVCGLVDIQNDKLLTKFVYYYLTITTKKYVSSGMGNPKLMSNVMAKIKVPIPPLKIQEEIVKILDKFTEYVTELTAELTAELTDRQKQYSFYRDKLLSFEDEVYQVEWKTLGEVAENLDYLRKPVTKGSRSSGIYPYYGASGIVDYVDDYIFDGDYLLVSEDGANLIARKTPIAFSVTGKSWINNHAHVLKFESDIDRKYVSYYLNHIDLTPYISGAAQPKLNQQNLNSIKLAYPKQEVRNKIVQVLDNFDAVCNDLSIGLPKEIELRQKQYEYFREKLLTFTAEGVYPGQWTVDSERGPSDLIRLLQWVFGTIRVELGAICTFTRGNGLQKKDFIEEGYPVIHYGQIYTRYGFSTDKTISFTDQSVFAKLKKAQPGDIVMATTSENVEDVGKAVVWEGNEEVGIGGHSCVLQTEQSSKFLVYYFQSNDFQRQKEKMVVGTKVIELYPKNIQKMLIVLPSFSTQKRIVAILDKFDALTNSIFQGLPKEIELRQKQYEYFRDTLLNFPNKYE
ncbi:restriction endonuclease subunit S [Streptococcus suis]|uniref:Type I restriction-modification system S protein n=1 Tax=Streptococcus suis TaxID=1307 RepID=A0A0Z8F3G4_STRSU|nr:restriction endonuclease subunit S [Streptococcus suis]NQH06718.1 restriction endonuclease subunit S [Streptococcus suis]NQH27547.1 restriction endonuclease subunit S [Streptococcus suis]NQH47053.1 restriction endonuclease subunit S [Streptococcus suis]NQO66291.1 restriction endonuclease subunit S [Streptococcus suis]NQP00544.1 restriction endonuclease subunit S [Streptococcus suis]